VAQRHGRTPGDLALAWMASRPAVSSVIAGVSSVEQLQRNAAACSWVLDPETIDEIDAITAPTGVPSPEKLPYAGSQARAAAAASSGS
jgi:aryl-alcohol dehydrogenase-like predicted oxidoreductase